jgi:predicted nucleic acid-binding protein
MKLVDTSAWVEFLRRKGNRRAKEEVRSLLEADSAAHTCPIRFELLCGARPDEETDLKEALDLSHRILFEAEDWHDAALLERKFRSKGLIVPRNDLFVATVAIRTGLPVVCRDAHFSAMSKALSKELKVDQI